MILSHAPTYASVRDRGREDRRRQDQVTENDAWTSQRPRLARDLKNAGADEDSDERRVRFERTKVAPQTRGKISRTIYMIFHDSR
jgi:hypothetical protein